MIYSRIIWNQLRNAAFGFVKSKKLVICNEYIFNMFNFKYE